MLKQYSKSVLVHWGAIQLLATRGSVLLWNLKPLPGLIVEIRINIFIHVESRNSSAVDVVQVSSSLFFFALFSLLL